MMIIYQFGPILQKVDPASWLFVVVVTGYLLLQALQLFDWNLRVEARSKPKTMDKETGKKKKKK